MAAEQISNELECAVSPYEERLSGSLEWALDEGGRHFEERSLVFEAMRKIASRLEALGIAYAIGGAMAMFVYGYRRYTETVDVLISEEDLLRVHAMRKELGYVATIPNGKYLRDAELGVGVKFWIAGEFPGVKKPKPVSFPYPEGVAVEIRGARYLQLPALIELKVASGMTGVIRYRQWSDVIELIWVCQLPEDFQERLDPFVRAKYVELWRDVQGRLDEWKAPV